MRKGRATLRKVGTLRAVDESTQSAGKTTAPQTFLFLQGHPSPFAKQLAEALERAGHRALRVNFCVGDVLYWRGRPSIPYRGTPAAWPQALTALIDREQVTDILYYGDCRPYHLAAREVAERLGVRAYVYEFGYLRPDWLTLERGGMSARSHFPDDPVPIRLVGSKHQMPDLRPRFRHSAAVELFHELIYQFSSYFLPFAFPHYDADRYYNPIIEYATGIPKQLRAARDQKHAVAVIDTLVEAKVPVFVFPLQLQCDYQLRMNAHYAHQSDVIREVVASFAANAPADGRLVFKCHPLDNGAEGWAGHIARATQACGVSGRVEYIEGGDLNRLLHLARGVVLINSTVGMHALIMKRPVKVLGKAVFDVEGATHRGTLDSFWRDPLQPDPDLVDALVKALAGTTQVRGSFFDIEGRAAAIATFVARLTNGQVNSDGAFVDPPPRSARP